MCVCVCVRMRVCMVTNVLYRDIVVSSISSRDITLNFE